MSLTEKADEIYRNYEIIGFNVPWSVPDVRYSNEEAILKVASGEKPLARLQPQVDEDEITFNEYLELLQQLVQLVKSTPRQVGNLEFWIHRAPHELPLLYFGRKEHYQLILASESTEDIKMKHILRGLAFGYPVDKIAAFLIRLREKQFIE